MPPFLLQRLHAWRPLAARVADWFTPGEPEPQDYPFAPTDLAELLRVDGGARAAGRDALDEPTWRDLLLAPYLELLGPGVSIFGRQVLYRRLRAGVDEDTVRAQRERVGALLADPARLDALHHRLRPLRHGDIEVAELLYERAMPPRPAWADRLWLLLLLPLALLASVVAALLVSPLAWLGMGTVMVALVSIQMTYGERLATWRRELLALQMLLRAVTLLDGGGPALADGFAGRGADAGRLNRSLADRPFAGAVPGARDYGDWFFLANVRHYFRTLAIVFARRDFLRACHRLCAELEADVALARHLRARTRDGAAWCWADRRGQRTLRMDGGLHPLLREAQPLSIALDGKGAFLSGQNGVGKSTLLRTLGLNLVVARAFGFAYAQQASLPPLPVLASMRNEDSLLDGQSLYIAELARARALLAAACAQPVVCLVDEVFRGTNHEEAVSAAAAVVDALARHALVVVSSHNLVLGSLLAHRLAPWRIVPAPDGGLRLEVGVLGRTNGVALLARHGFGEGIQREAARVAAWLARQREPREADVYEGPGMGTGRPRGASRPD